MAMASGTTTTAAADTKEALVSKRSNTSVVWNYFSFRKDAAQRHVLCKTCLATVATSRGNPTNLFQHLKKTPQSLI